MFFTFSPAFYYAIHEKDIDKFLISKTNGEDPHLLDYIVLRGLLKEYIQLNSDGIDESKSKDYIQYICEKILPYLQY